MNPFSPSYHFPKGSLLTLILLVCLMWIAGCGLVGNDEKKLREMLAPENELIPLAVGNYWVYEQWLIDPTWLDTVRTEVMDVQDIIVEGTKIRSFGTHRFRYDERPRADALLSRTANGPDGYYSLGFVIPSGSLLTLSQGLFYKYPAIVGESWQTTTVLFHNQSGDLSFGNTRTIELLDTTKTVETPAGVFENCYVYVFNDFRTATLLYHHMYIKPKVGIVGVDTFEADNPNDTSVLHGQQRLIEYKLN